MNQITVAGIIGKDSEIRSTKTGEMVANFSLADSQGREKQPIWWNCALYGKRAESMSKYLTKGQPITVVGTLLQSKYTDKTGVERTSFDLRINEIALQGKSERSEEPKKARVKDVEDADIPF